MSEIQTPSTIDSMFKEFLETFNAPEISEDVPTEWYTMSFYVPLQYKVKFDLIQAKSKKKFGKLLKELIIQSIDKVQIEADAG